MIASIRFAVAATLAAGFAAAPLLAEPAAPTAIVRTADLDLATPSGAQALHSRVLRAVRQVCGEVDSRDLRGQQEVAACRAVALRDADAKVEVALAAARSAPAVAVNQLRAVAPGS